VGVEITERAMRDLMIPDLVTGAIGLRDGSGGQVAQLFRNQFGVQAGHQRDISFDQMAARAGRQPLAIGGLNWAGQGRVHWVAVRRFEDGRLILANPGGTGPLVGQQTLDRAAFNQRGGFSAVWIDVAGTEDGRASRNADRGPRADFSGIPFAAHSRFRVVHTDGMGVRLRERPLLDGGRRDGAPEGSVVDGEEHAWRLVQTEGRVTGWVADTYLRAEDGRFRVAGTDGLGVRVRALPFPGGGQLSSVAEGALVTGLEEAAYRQIRNGGGVAGWATADYLDRVPADDDPREHMGSHQDGQDGDGELGGSASGWTPALGAAIAKENLWDEGGQPVRRAAMERFNQLPGARRRAIFDAAMDAGLTAEGITSAGERNHWKQAMRAVVVGDGFPGECPDLNPFMLAGESGGVFRGGADRLNSSALGYFQFIAQKPIDPGEPFSPPFDYGHWRNCSPFPSDYSRQTDPVCQVRQFIRAIKGSRKHHGDPLSVVREKSTPPFVWGP